MASSISEAPRRRCIVAAAMLVAIAGALAAAPVARAQPAAVSDGAREAARAKLVEGVDALKRGDYQAALQRFEEAYALVPSPKIHYDFGLAYVGLGRSAEALAAFERFLAEAPDAPVDKRERAVAQVSALRARVAEAPAREQRDGAGGVSERPAPAAALSAPSVTSAASAGQPAAAAKTAGDDPLRTRRIVGIAVGAGGAALLAAGALFGVLAQHESDGLTHDSQMATPVKPTPFDPGKESRGITYERLQIVGLVVGGIAAAAGAVLYASSRRRLVVEPGAGASVAGATVQLTF